MLYESALCQASINLMCRSLPDNLSSQILYGMAINRVKMSGNWRVSLKTDIGNVFFNTGLKRSTGFSNIQDLLGSAFLAANHINNIRLITRERTPNSEATTRARYLRVLIQIGTRTTTKIVARYSSR